MKPLLLLFIILDMYNIFTAQMPIASRMTNWNKAGTHANLPTYNHIPFHGDPYGSK
jgi:hypothetical protein